MAQSKQEWLIFAITSGGCAALNGAFAKLTTTTLTSSWATRISHFLHVEEHSQFVELMGFFLLNIAFNGVMWGLFTRALTLSNSTVRVSVINTSANFMVTAVLGTIVFSEELPGLWWVGAALLVAGSVIIGRREEDNEARVKPTLTPKESLGDQIGSPAAATKARSSGTEVSVEESLVQRQTSSRTATTINSTNR